MRLKKYILSIVVVLLIHAPCLVSQGVSYELPLPVQATLRHLGEAYRVLDLAAGKIWPGWDGYRDVPFKFQFDNGLSVCVGFPKPPEGFELLTNMKLDGKSIHID